ncbi:uncharacterized protein [Eucyclogobius newberryi]|uniref:uncharacterized protein n=1 Tax=Eucyclogobius newberryi TaxID=166745 RepID=UPI003B58C265
MDKKEEVISNNIFMKMSQNQPNSTMFTVHGMRKFVCDRLTEAAQEILGAFETRAQEYELELSRQRRLLERVYSEHNPPRPTGPFIKEEEPEICITDVQQTISSPSLHGVHSESQSSNPKEIQNTDRSKPERASHLETKVPSLAQDPSSTQKTPTKHNKCSHGYKLPKTLAPKQNNTNKDNDKAPRALEIIEIEDDSSASSDIEMIQEDKEPAAASQNIREISDHGKERNTTNTNNNETSEESKKHESGEKSSPPQLHSPVLDNNHDYFTLNLTCETKADNMEHETTSSDVPSVNLDVSTHCFEPVDDEENITLHHDADQNEELICEDSTGDKTDGKGESKDEKSGEEVHKDAHTSSMANVSVMDNNGMLDVITTINYQDIADYSSSTSESYQGQTDTASIISNEKRLEENTGKSSANPAYSFEWKRPKQPDPKPSHKSPFECDQCGKVSTNFKNYKSHVKSHTAEKKFKCETCDKMFREKGDLKKHRMIHTGEKPFKCSYCDKMFNRRFNMALHVRVHTGERPYKCASCSKTFSTQVNLRKHERVHTGEKPYACERCQKEFADSSAYRNHQRVHTGERPYKCHRCKKKFATRTTLKRHSSLHTGEKPYECSTCHKCFVTNTDLKVHSRIHTGERPYKCEQCGQQFSWWTNYNRHRKTHKRTPAEPPVE